MKAVVTSLLLVSVAALPAFVRAEDKDKATSDADFVIKALTASTGEIKVGEYAAKHANDAKVREYAERLVKDHTALNNTIAENAKRMKVAVVLGKEKEPQQQIDQLSKLKGNDFDVAYLQQMVEDHQKAITLFESEDKIGTDGDLKTAARNALPTLKKHLDDAKDLLAKLKK